MYFDTRAEPCEVQRSVARTASLQVHLRIDRRQRVLPRRRQHLEEGAVAIVVPIAHRRTPTGTRPAATAEPNACVQRCPHFARHAAGTMRLSVPVAGLRRAPRRPDRARRVRVGDTRAYEPPIVAIVTSTGRSIEPRVVDDRGSHRVDRDRRSRTAATRRSRPCAWPTTLRDLHLRHRQVGRLLEAALRRHECRAVEVPAGFDRHRRARRRSGADSTTTRNCRSGATAAARVLSASSEASGRHHFAAG